MTPENIIKDVLALATRFPHADISRDFYRMNGSYSMGDVISIFGTFRNLRSHVRKGFEVPKVAIREDDILRTIKELVQSSDPTQALPESAGIYAWVNLSNLKVYIGQSLNLRSRHRQHQRQLLGGVHTNQHLQASWDVYGSELFRFVVIERLQKCRTTLKNEEQKYIDIFRANDPNLGYNKAPSRRSC